MAAKKKSETEEKAVVLIFGEDEYGVSQKAAEVVAELCPPANQAFGLEVIEGNVEKADDAAAAIGRCVSALRTVSFLGDGKVVWLRDVSFLAQNRLGCAEEVKNALERLVNTVDEQLPAGQRLVISSSKVTKTMSFYKWAKKEATIHEFVLEEKKKGEEQSQERAMDLFQAAKLRISDSLLKMFVGRTGAQGRQMAQDVEKLRLYLGEEGASVTAEAIDLLVPTTRETIVWELSEAVGRRELPRALAIFRKLKAQGESMVHVLMNLENHLSRLLVLRGCLDRGWLRLESSGYRENTVWNVPPEGEEMLESLDKDDPRKGHPYRTLLLAQQAALFRHVRDLLRARERLVRAHLDAFSGVPDELVTELALIEMVGDKSRG